MVARWHAHLHGLATQNHEIFWLGQWQIEQTQIHSVFRVNLNYTVFSIFHGYFLNIHETSGLALYPNAANLLPAKICKLALEPRPWRDGLTRLGQDLT